MGNWINAQGEYYEGDRASLADRGVPQRPSALHVWKDDMWVEDPVKQAEAAKIEQRKQDLEALPTWEEFNEALDKATTIAGLKVLVRRLGRAVYN